MAIIVDKEEKRRNIALASKALLLEHGIGNITISQIAKEAGVGKGTIYEYFSNKEDIVFEVITIFIDEYFMRLEGFIDTSVNTKMKIIHFLYTLYDDALSNEKIRIYQEFLAISLTQETDEMIAFNMKFRQTFLEILEKILNEGIEKNEIPAKAINLSSPILIFSLGLVVDIKTSGLDPKEEIDGFVQTLFDLIEIKEHV